LRLKFRRFVGQQRLWAAENVFFLRIGVQAESA
jgi:hypothetical protein